MRQTGAGHRDGAAGLQGLGDRERGDEGSHAVLAGRGRHARPAYGRGERIEPADVEVLPVRDVDLHARRRSGAG